MRKTIIGVMGGEHVNEGHVSAAKKLGQHIAKEGWVLLNGGRDVGIMEASAKGAKEENGLTIGILPGINSDDASDYIDVAIVTGIGDARNYVNILSSDIVIACPGGAGTISEIALALKSNRKVILMDFDIGHVFDAFLKRGLLFKVKTPEEAIDQIKQILKVPLPHPRIK